VRWDKIVAKPEWGTKRECPDCGARFYDLGKELPLVCPKCAFEYEPEVLLKPKRAKIVEEVAKPIEVEKPVKKEPDEVETDDAADDDALLEADDDDDDAAVVLPEDDDDEDDKLLEVDDDEEDVIVVEKVDDLDEIDELPSDDDEDEETAAPSKK